ncbi:MAG: hypothetical protein V4555_14220 [Acidobacteriota bacterium]
MRPCQRTVSLAWTRPVVRPATALKARVSRTISMLVESAKQRSMGALMRMESRRVNVML